MAVDEQFWRAVMSGRRRGALTLALRAALAVAAAGYGLAVRLRRRLYERGLLGSAAAAVPVISVGNITTGGAGKTPVVAWAVRRLAEAGFTPAVLTRGYRAAAGVSDEAELLKQAADGRVVVNADRRTGAAEAVAAGADVLVMDDGLQHLRLRRDMDIVLIDATCPFGYGRLLPAGLLREPPGVLRRAGVVLLTRTDLVDPAELERIEARLARLSAAPLLRSRMRPAALALPDGTSRPAESLSGRRVLAFCGLGNPEAFYATLRGLGAEVVEAVSFNDHHPYAAADLANLARRADAAGAELTVTTAKDAVKIRPLGGPGQPAVLEIDLDLPDAQRRRLLDILLSVCGGRKDVASGPF